MRGLARGWAGSLARSPAGVFGLVVVGSVVLLALSASLIAPHDPNAIDLTRRFRPPAWDPGGSWTYPIGTDSLGRDVLSRLIYGARISLLVGVAAVAIAGSLGIVLGLAAGYYRGWIDRVLMRLIDAMLSIPMILLLLFVLAVVGQGLPQLIGVIGLTTWVPFARVIRAEVLSVRERPFVLAARSAGSGDLRLVAGHVLPHVLASFLVLATLMTGGVIIAEASLGFLGLGVAGSQISWGSMLNDARAYLATKWWVGVFPGAAITLTVVGITFLGDAIRDAMDPHLKRSLAHEAVPLLSAAGSIDDDRTEEALPGMERRPGGSSGTAAFAQSGGRPDGLLVIDGLTLAFGSSEGHRTVLDGVSLSVARGESLAIVGESGSGKTMTCLSILGLLPRSATVRGRIQFAGQDLLELRPRELRRLCGRRIAMIFQDPIASLNPVYTVGDQLREVLRVHLGMSRKQATPRIEALLRQVGLPDPTSAAQAYPHQLSGGMCQRVAIAIALACDPDLVIADEPTTALDVSVQAQILALLRDLCRDRGTALILVTHDFGVVAEIADRVAVMYAGRVVEDGTLSQVFEGPQHPYTVGLLECAPRVDVSRDVLPSIPGVVARIADVAACGFASRCPLADARCRTERPELARAGDHLARCFHAGELSRWRAADAPAHETVRV